MKGCAMSMMPAVQIQAPLRLVHSSPQAIVESAPAPKRETLPFRIRIVSDEAALHRAVSIRRAAYARHVPEVARILETPEEADFQLGNVVLLAESKLDGTPLGTMRIHTNLYRPLPLERSVELPPLLRRHSLAEATRLGIALGRTGHVVKTALFKCFFECCRLWDIDWMVIAGRSPLDRMYTALMFDEVFPGKGFIPMQHAANIPHRVLKLRVESVPEIWAQNNHPLYEYFFKTQHPDFELTDGPSLNLPMRAA